MPNYDPQLRSDLDSFRQRVYNGLIDILDPPTIHHEFVSGNHGRKLDFDKVKTGSDPYIQWVALFARVIKSTYAGQQPDALVGIANGANRLAGSIVPLLGERTLALTTEKETYGGSVRLDEESADLLHSRRLHRGLALIIDDVGSTGSTAASVVNHLKEFDFGSIQAVYFWQRTPSLPYFEQLGVSYSAAINEELPMFTPEQCLSQTEGYCAQNVELIPYGTKD